MSSQRIRFSVLVPVAAILLSLGACRGGSPDLPSTPTLPAPITQTPTDEPTTPEPTPPQSSEPEATASQTVAPTPGPDASNDVIQLTSPVEGQVVDGPAVTFTGQATAFEGVGHWRIFEAANYPTTSRWEGNMMTGSMGDLAPFEFTHELPAGSWVIEISSPSAKDGSLEHAVHATFTVQ